jgi:hypothetical protein
MPLTPDALAQRLENDWLGEPFPGSALESADRFAGAVANWFSGATAASFPVATAMPRRPQLTAAAAGALAAGLGPAAGQLLALAAASYLAGQTFGAGTATFPLAVAAGVAGITAAFNHRELSNSARAQQIALATYAMTVSTIVTFPAPLPPAPIL